MLENFSKSSENSIRSNGLYNRLDSSGILSELFGETLPSSNGEPEGQSTDTDVLDVLDVLAEAGDSSPFNQSEREGMAADFIRRLRGRIKSRAEVKRRRYSLNNHRVPKDKKRGFAYVETDIELEQRMYREMIGDQPIKLGRKISAKQRRGMRYKLFGLENQEDLENGF